MISARRRAMALDQIDKRIHLGRLVARRAAHSQTNTFGAFVDELRSQGEVRRTEKMDRHLRQVVDLVEAARVQPNQQRQTHGDDQRKYAIKHFSAFNLPSAVLCVLCVLCVFSKDIKDTKDTKDSRRRNAAKPLSTTSPPPQPSSA